MVDFDGSFEHSKIVTVGSQVQEDHLLVYPNPAQNEIFLQSPHAVRSVNLVDQKGNNVLSLSFLKEEKSLTIPLPKLHSGTYYLKVNQDSENQQTKQVVIQ
jgi:hypothetical protein